MRGTGRLMMLAVMVGIGLVAAPAMATIVLEDGSGTTTDYTLGGYAASVTSETGDSSGYASFALGSQAAGTSYNGSSFSRTNIAGNRSGYMNGSIELDIYIPDGYTATQRLSYFSFYVWGMVGGEEKRTYIRAFTWSNPHNTWDSVVLNLEDGLFTTTGSTGSFDSANTGGTLDAGDVDEFWQNITRWMFEGVTYKHLTTSTDIAVRLDNVELIPEPATFGLLAAGGVSIMFRRRKK